MSDLTEEQAAEIMRQFSAGKQNVHSFFTDIIKTDDTTKTGNLNEDELGQSKLPLRTYKELELFSREIYMDDTWGDYFKKMAEIQTSTSLSKDAILLRLSVTQKKEMADTTPSKVRKNSGWFKKGETKKP